MIAYPRERFSLRSSASYRARFQMPDGLVRFLSSSIHELRFGCIYSVRHQPINCAWMTLNSTRQDQDKQDNHDYPDSAGRVLAPPRAVRPGGERTEQDDHQNDEKDCSEHFNSLLASYTP